MTFFNNNTSQMVITAFLDWMSKISIEKYQTVSISGSDYYVQRKIIPVPCQYATREKFIEIVRSSSARRQMNPDQLNQVELQWVLPRISVNLTGTTYDQSRRLVKTQQIDDIRNSFNSKTNVYSPTPYNLDLEVSTISRNIDENFQIMEQIVPYFSPAMNMNLKLHSNAEPESIKFVLNSVTMDNPTDIPENDERLFTNTYSFTAQVNYFIPRKTMGIIDNITINLQNGMELLRINKTYIESLNTIQDKFTEYITNSTMPVPVTKAVVPSTYAPKVVSDEDLLDLLQGDYLILTQGVSSIELYTPALSGDNTIYQSYTDIYYRLDDSNEIFRYLDPIEITFSKIYYWIELTTKETAKQLEVFEYTVI